MAYEKQQWDTTSFVNPTRMNHIEEGIKANSDEVASLNNDLANTKKDVSDLNNDLANTKKDVSDLNSNLTTHKTSADHDSRYYTKAQTNALLTSDFGTVSSVVDVDYTKRSGFVFAMCQNAPSSAIPANVWTVIANIPKGYRPKYNVPFVGNFGSLTFIGYFYPNGDIVIYPTQELPTGGNGICFNISYPVA